MLSIGQKYSSGASGFFQNDVGSNVLTKSELTSNCYAEVLGLVWTSL